MRIIVIGAGEVGYHIAERLSHEAHEIVVVERSAEVCRRVRDQVGVRAIEADGSSPRALEAAGVQDAAMVIAVADVDEVNIVACAIAHQYGVTTKIARVRDIELGGHPILAGGKVLGIDLLINPTQVVADEILRVIKTTGAAEVADFADGRVQLLGVKIGAGAPVVNRRLRDLRSVQASSPFLVVGIARGERLIVPTLDTVVAADDHLYVVSRRDVIPDILVLLGRSAAATRRVFIIGGGRIGLQVAQSLETEGVGVTVMEKSEARCEELARHLRHSRVLHGDGTDVRRIIEEGITGTDALATITDDDPTNLLAALLGKRHGARKAVALFKRRDLIPLVTSLGIDAAISPRLLTASVILRFVRGGRVVSVFELPESEAETLEVVVQGQTLAAGRSLEAIALPPDALVGAIVRGEEVLVPERDTVLEIGDHVILLALPRAIPAVERLFGL
ncbi:MAG TPA: Trk system potassium transporter TrkA [Methylomirabilota bacterium]|nr:Trk system potassium transporter TrkA [Methylomirabilota bacterium]